MVLNVTCACGWHPCELESFAIQVVGTSTTAWAEGLTLTLSCPDFIHLTTRKGPKSVGWARPLGNCSTHVSVTVHCRAQPPLQVGAVVLLGKCLSCKPKDLSSALSTGHGRTFVTADLKQWGDRKDPCSSQPRWPT